MDLSGNMEGKKGLGKKNGMSGGRGEKGCVSLGSEAQEVEMRLKK